ncbi:MAG: Yae1 family protein [Candidatus Magnetominusculus sp. LBB02]|nr:Yae1 family protein [Candidatus Magnetominusculus sp. LBB02]
MLKDIPAKFLKILTGYEDGKFLDVQLPNIQLNEMDLLIELPDDSLLHLEIQSTNDKDMLKRMYLYSALVYNQFEILPRQVLLYVGNRPLDMKNAVGSYSYELLDIRDINCSELLQSEKPEDVVLAILCQSDNIDVTIAKILEKLSRLPLRARKDYILKLLYLSDLRKLYNKITQEVEKMPITIDIAESDLYKDIFHRGELAGKLEGKLEGKRAGIQEGKREGLLEGIELGLEIKYGAAGVELMSMVRIISTVDRLEELKNLIRKSDSLEKLKEFFEKGNSQS